MKILQIMAGGKDGGAETAFVDMCIAMYEKGQEVEVVTRRNPNRVELMEEAGLKVHTLPFGGFADIYTKRVLKSIIADFQPDIVQTWMSRAAHKTPNWEQTKSSKKYSTVARLGGYYDLKYFKNMDYFAAITPDIKSYLIARGVNENNVRQLNNFAETENEISPLKRKDLDTPKDATVLISLARLHDDKALDVVMKAIKDMPDVYLWLAGDGPLKGKLQKEAEKLNISERVKFLGWRNDRAALLQAADICVFASRDEPFGTVFVQSWANKTPVIVSDAQGPKQFCENGSDCLMVQRDNVEQLTAAIIKLKDDNVLQMQLVNKGYQRYINEFTKEKSVEKYLEFYQDIISQST